MNNPVSEKVLAAIRAYRKEAGAIPCVVRWAPDVENDVLAELVAADPKALEDDTATPKAKGVTFVVDRRIPAGMFVIMPD